MGGGGRGGGEFFLGELKVVSGFHPQVLTSLNKSRCALWGS